MRGSPRPIRSIREFRCPPILGPTTFFRACPSSGAARSSISSEPRRGSRVARRRPLALEHELASAGVRATKVADDELARFLEADGRLVRLGDGYAIGAGAFEVAKDVLLAECRAEGEISLARFRDLVGTGRRDAQLLLERFDADGLTRRQGDGRVLRRAATSRPSA